MLTRREKISAGFYFTENRGNDLSWLYPDAHNVTIAEKLSAAIL